MTPAAHIDVDFLYEERIYGNERRPDARLVTIPCRLAVVDDMPEVASFTLANGRSTTYRGFKGRAFLSISDFRALGLGCDPVPDVALDGRQLYMTDLGERCANKVDQELAEHADEAEPRRRAPIQWGDDVQLDPGHLARIGEHVERYRAAVAIQAVAFDGRPHVVAPFPRWHTWRGNDISLEYRSGPQFETSCFPAEEHDKALAFAALGNSAGAVIATRGAVLVLDGRYREPSLLESIGHGLCRMLVSDSEGQIDRALATMSSDLVRSWILVREAAALRRLIDPDHAKDCIAAGMAIDEAVRNCSIRLDERIARRLKSPAMRGYRQRAFVEGLVPASRAPGSARAA